MRVINLRFNAIIKKYYLNYYAIISFKKKENVIIKNKKYLTIKLLN